MSMKFSSAQLSALAVAAVLSACTVQERVYVPAPRPYVPPPPPPPVAQVEVEAGPVEVTATEAPPPLPDYEQPPCPEDGYLWTPGYWAFGGGGYYWVPGTWVQPPRVGVLWTPGYWGFAGGVYGFHAGYWGPHIGFYGGVNYGFGYVGVGFAGGRWDGGHFAYNTAVNNVNVTVIHNTYNQTVVNNNVTRVSFNGGAGGVQARPTVQERTFAQEPHIAPTPVQVQHRQEASNNPALAARANGGHPSIAATARPAQFSGPGVVGAHGAANVHPDTPSGNTPRNGLTSPAANTAHAPAAEPNAVHPRATAPSSAAHPQVAQARPAAVKPPAAKPAAPKPQQQPKRAQGEKPRE
jgi:hypothetical protein